MDKHYSLTYMHSDTVKSYTELLQRLNQIGIDTNSNIPEQITHQFGSLNKYEIRGNKRIGNIIGGLHTSYTEMNGISHNIATSATTAPVKVPLSEYKFSRTFTASNGYDMYMCDTHGTYTTYSGLYHKDLRTNKITQLLSSSVGYRFAYEARNGDVYVSGGYYSTSSWYGQSTGLYRCVGNTISRICASNESPYGITRFVELPDGTLYAGPYSTSSNDATASVYHITPNSCTRILREYMYLFKVNDTVYAMTLRAAETTEIIKFNGESYTTLFSTPIAGCASIVLTDDNAYVYLLGTSNIGRFNTQDETIEIIDASQYHINTLYKHNGIIYGTYSSSTYKGVYIINGTAIQMILGSESLYGKIMCVTDSNNNTYLCCESVQGLYLLQDNMLTQVLTVGSSYSIYYKDFVGREFLFRYGASILLDGLNSQKLSTTISLTQDTFYTIQDSLGFYVCNISGSSSYNPKDLINTSSMYYIPYDSLSIKTIGGGAIIVHPKLSYIYLLYNQTSSSTIYAVSNGVYTTKALSYSPKYVHIYDDYILLSEDNIYPIAYIKDDTVTPINLEYYKLTGKLTK